MPIQPTPGDVHVDRALSDLSVAYIQSKTNFVAAQVFPNVPVEYRSDQYFVYNREAFFRTDVQLRAPGAPSAGTGFDVTTDSYLAAVYAVHQDLADQTVANAESPINLKRDATELVTQQLLQYREQQFVTNYFTTGVWGTDKTGTTDFTQWSDATSTPIEDIREGIVTMAKQTSYRANTLVLGPRVFQFLMDHPDFLDRIKFTQGPAMVAEALIAQLLGLDKVLVAWSVKNTEEEGETFTAAADMDFNFGDHALLAHVPSSPGLQIPSPGYTFSWTGFLGAGTMGTRIKQFRMEENASDRIEGEMAYDMKVVATDLGYFFNDAVA